MNKSDYDKYYKKGGTYVIPVEVFNDLCDEIERLTELCNKYEEEHNTTFEEWKKTISIINEIEKELNKDFNTYMMGNRQSGKVYKAGANNYRMHIYLRLQELKGSDKE